MREQVDVEVAVDVLVGELEEGFAVDDACVVDQDRDGAELEYLMSACLCHSKDFDHSRN